MNFEVRKTVIKEYINTNIDIGSYLEIAKKCKDDELLRGKLYLLDIHLLEYIFIIMFYDHNIVYNISDEHDFYHKLKFLENFLIFKLNNFNSLTVEIDCKILIIFKDIICRYEKVKKYVNELPSGSL
jgi:hypothetical protein